MLNELRKFYNDLSVKILFVLIIVVSIAVSILSINSFSAIESADSDSIVKGKPAIQILSDRYENIAGELHITKLNEALSYYQSVPNPDVAYVESNIAYPGVISLLSDAYSPVGASETDHLEVLQDTQDFYHRYILKIDSIVKSNLNDYKTWEADEIVKKAESITVPFRLEFSRPWTNVYKSLTLVFILISLSAILIGSRIYSYEKEQGMDIILATLGRNKMQEIGRNKLLAMLTFLSVEFLIGVLIVSVCIFSRTGISAWSSQIQIEYFTSIYNLTFGSAYLLFIFMAWISLMAIGFVVATLNAIWQKSYQTMVIACVIIFLPVLAVRISALPLVFRKFMAMQPINGLSIVGNLLSLQLFNFVFTKGLTTSAIIISSLFIFMVCKAGAPILFSFRIRNT